MSPLFICWLDYSPLSRWDNLRRCPWWMYWLLLWHHPWQDNLRHCSWWTEWLLLRHHLRWYNLRYHLRWYNLWCCLQWCGCLTFDCTEPSRCFPPLCSMSFSWLLLPWRSPPCTLCTDSARCQDSCVYVSVVSLLLQPMGNLTSNRGSA
jgi:hypothetical protein